MSVHWGGRGAGHVSRWSAGSYPLVINFIPDDLDARITFTRASIGTFLGSNGLVQTAAINTARFPFNSSPLVLQGLLIEPQATNLARYSEQFDNAAWSRTGTATVTANTTVAPDGTTTADTLNMPASGDRINLSAIAITGGTTYTASLWLSGSGTTYISLASSGGTFKTASTLITLTTTPTRYSVSLVTNANNTAVFPIIGRYNGVTGAGTATSAIIWGYQFETGAVATSYIQTVAASVIRSTDSAALTIPSGVAKLRYVFDNDTVQDVAVTAGAYTIPTSLNRSVIKAILGLAY